MNDITDPFREARPQDGVLSSEAAVRSMRQLPIETDPPAHTDYRAIVEPHFQRAKQPQVIRKVQALIAEKLSESLDRETVEVVSHFALPIQSRALTVRLTPRG